MKKNYFAFGIVFIFLFNLNGFSQINAGGTPYSFQKSHQIKTNLIFEHMPAIDTEQLLAEDEINDKFKDIPWRFGEEFEVNFSLKDNGIWEELPKGGRLWRLGIESEGAFSLNLIFDNYLLPPEAKLYIYNVDKTQVIGAFTDFNNQEDRMFATTLVKGDAIILEYYEPNNAEFSGELLLGTVVHAYRDVYGYIKSFGSSGSCNNNVACPEAAGWENEIRSASHLILGGSVCSGALVNNTTNDGTAYYLSANHCYSSPGSLVFWFNWQSPTCSNPTSSPSYDAMSGAVDRARNASSDFWLVELNNRPQDVGIDVYYAGWNRENSPSSLSVGIHHPSGDIKKISFDDDPSVSSDYDPNPYLANSHWEITAWDDGTTEGGSSGSPLFDQNHRITGQLHGGWASCTSITQDYYGKFSMSWDYGGTSSTQLVDWLDPSGSVGLTLDGYDPTAPTVLTANFIGNPTNVQLGNPVMFTNWSSGPNTIIDYQWTFEGGTPGTASGPGPHNIIYNTIGSFDVTLEVDDGFTTDTKYEDDYIDVFDCSVTTFPFTEGFENGGSIPDCWSNEYEINNQDWSFQSGGHNSNPSGANNGSYNALLYNGSFTANVTKLVTPKFNMSGLSSATLTFWHTQVFWPNDQDELRIYYKNSSGGSWNILATYTNNISNWTQETINLPSLSNDYYIAFEGTAQYGYGVCIDDVNIAVVPIGGPPTCTSPSNPLDGIIDVGVSTDLEWNAAPGATGYNLFFGTDNPPTNIVNGDDQGNTTMYSPIGSLDLNTVYYWRVIPYNTYGTATGCSDWSFTTSASLCEIVEIDVLTDDYGYETSWQLEDEAGNVLLSGGQGGVYADNTHYIETICLDHGCYTFIINDTYGDGICCAYGNGSYTISNLSTSELYGSGGDFSSSESVPFCVTVGSSGEWIGGVTGSESDWESSMNWGDGIVPTAGVDVVIPSSPIGGTYPETNTGPGAVCNDLTLEAGTHIHVPSNNTLAVNGTLTNHAGTSGLVIKSTANDATGSLLHSTPDVNATVEKYLTDMQWHFIGIPVENEIAGVFHFPSGHSDVYLKTHNESTNTWGDWIVPINTPLHLGQGYEVWVGDVTFAQDEIIEFKGELNTGDQTTGTGVLPNLFYDLEYTTGHGLNLISNPYPSALQANISSWTRNNVNPKVWTWSHAHGNYVFWGSGDNYSYGTPAFGNLTGGIIPAMQGFFVEAIGTSPLLTIPQADRIHSSLPYYKNSDFVNTLRLDVEGNNYSDAIFISFNEYATDEYDGEYDIKKMYGLDEAPQLYSVLPQEKLSINSLSILNGYRNVQLGFECQIPGVFKIEADELESFENSLDIYLEDIKEGILQKLGENSSYSFSHQDGDNPLRFVVHFGAPSNVGSVNENFINIYSFNNTVYIQNPQMTTGFAKIHNIIGEDVYNQETPSDKVIKVELDVNPGYYLVTFESQETKVCQKVFIK